MRTVTHLGTRIRSLRRQAGLTQVALAKQLGISASYLNLMEHDRRPVTAELLLSLAQSLDVDLRKLAAGADAALLADVIEVFADPILEDHPLTSRDVRLFVETAPEAARAVVRLHQAYVSARAGMETLQMRVLDASEAGPGMTGVGRAQLSSEQVTDFVQRQSNYFAALETEAERVWTGAGLEGNDLFGALTRYLASRHGIRVRVLRVGEMRAAMRRYQPKTQEIQLSEALPRGSRNFELGALIGLLECGDAMGMLLRDAGLTSDETHALGRVALGNYFAGAVLMPYARFLAAAEEERYDIEVLGHRFGVGWEQVCHRLTTLRRPGAEGIPFYLVRVDLAGNISKRLSAAGVQLPRYSGLCALWNVHGAFQQPGRVRVQLARMPDGRMLLAIARTVRRHRGGYRAPNSLYAVGIGCDAAHAKRLVYADGRDTTSPEVAVPVGITCRLCERSACAARATPSLHQPLRIDENVRGVSFYTPSTR
jgi:predicted transcriptional regulator/transcriptional regulator with XRE-family HTH domain